MFGAPSVSQGPPYNLGECWLIHLSFIFNDMVEFSILVLRGFRAFEVRAPIEGMLEFLLIRQLNIHDSRSATKLGVFSIYRVGIFF